MISRARPENRWLPLGLRLLLSGVFLYAGALKFASPQPFADSIFAFHLLPESLINLLALGLPVFELAAGGLLLLGKLRRAASLGVLTMTAVFALAIASALARGLPADCGCFGAGSGSIYQGWISLGRDLLLGAAAFMLCRQERRVMPQPPARGSKEH